MDMQQPASPFTAPELKTLLPCAGMTTCYPKKNVKCLWYRIC